MDKRHQPRRYDVATRKANLDFTENRKRIFTGIKRQALAHIDFREVLCSGEMFSVCYRSSGRYMLLSGFVTRIISYSDGDLIMFRPASDSTIRWETIPLWIPIEGGCGILASWVTDSIRFFQQPITC